MSATVIEELARQQHLVVGVWQLARMRIPRDEIRTATRGLRRVHRGVVALGDISELGWLMAAALALGPGAAISRHSGLALWDLRAPKAGDIDVTVPGRSGRAGREGIAIHRPRGRFDTDRRLGIPVTTPTQTIVETPLRPHELYRVLEAADRAQLHIDRGRLAERRIVDLQRTVKGVTRSDSEAAFVLLCHEHQLKLPLVNHRLNGCETDFHWPHARLVVEVDGYDHHKERYQFETDRRRGLAHRANGYEVIRLSANQVYDEAPAVVRGLLSAAPSLALAE